MKTTKEQRDYLLELEAKATQECKTHGKMLDIGFRYGCSFCMDLPVREKKFETESRNALKDLLADIEELEAFKAEALDLIRRNRQVGVWLSEDSRKYPGTDAGNAGRNIVAGNDIFLKKHAPKSGEGEG